MLVNYLYSILKAWLCKTTISYREMYYTYYLPVLGKCRFSKKKKTAKRHTEAFGKISWIIELHKKKTASIKALVYLTAFSHFLWKTTTKKVTLREALIKKKHSTYLIRLPCRDLEYLSVGELRRKKFSFSRVFAYCKGSRYITHVNFKVIIRANISVMLQWFIFSFVLMYRYTKQRKKPNCTKANIESQHFHRAPWYYQYT